MVLVGVEKTVGVCSGSVVQIWCVCVCVCFFLFFFFTVLNLELSMLGPDLIKLMLFLHIALRTFMQGLIECRD